LVRNIIRRAAGASIQTTLGKAVLVLAAISIVAVSVAVPVVLTTRQSAEGKDHMVKS